MKSFLAYCLKASLVIAGWQISNMYKINKKRQHIKIYYKICEFR